MKIFILFPASEPEQLMQATSFLAGHGVAGEQIESAPYGVELDFMALDQRLADVAETAIAILVIPQKMYPAAIRLAVEYELRFMLMLHAGQVVRYSGAHFHINRRDGERTVLDEHPLSLSHQQAYTADAVAWRDGFCVTLGETYLEIFKDGYSTRYTETVSPYEHVFSNGAITMAKPMLVYPSGIPLDDVEGAVEEIKTSTAGMWLLGTMPQGDLPQGYYQNALPKAQPLVAYLPRAFNQEAFNLLFHWWAFAYHMEGEGRLHALREIFLRRRMLMDNEYESDVIIVTLSRDGSGVEYKNGICQEYEVVTDDGHTCVYLVGPGEAQKHFLYQITH